ncbi:glycosyltransferase family 2 protein [Paenibacillus thiaminolyticus]|uniref:glycosyltransferase family 2 protein n=1 Tax=Paenibacillus thiaminolyticus TaxID=49283 RepID=UPI0035A68E65
MSSVQVLLSSYNGEQYIQEQLLSIVEQSYSDIDILVRDDGSSDQTASIIRQVMEHTPHISLIEEENIGVIPSFFSVLARSNESMEYYCFCDQDDVWMQNKVASAVKHLAKYKSPAMVFTSTQLVDNNLSPIKIWPETPKRLPSFENALVENIAVGATITMNKAARDLILSKLVHSERVMMHDWWVYLCISAFGTVIYDPQPSMYYRQHGNNVVGGNRSFIQKWTRKWKSYRKHAGRRLLYKQAEEFYRLYGDKLTVEKREQLELFLAHRETVVQRIQYLRKCRLYRQSWIDQKLFQFLIMIGYI